MPTRASPGGCEARRDVEAGRPVELLIRSEVQHDLNSATIHDEPALLLAPADFGVTLVAVVERRRVPPQLDERRTHSSISVCCAFANLIPIQLRTLEGVAGFGVGNLLLAEAEGGELLLAAF